MMDWLERASDLLLEDDPGPTPFLVESLIVDQAVAVIQGPAKVAKTWTTLELARAIATGSPAFGRFDVPNPGPVILVLEESGRAALHRRLDALTRGNAQTADTFDEFHFAANQRVKLDDRDWQLKLVDAARVIAPRAIILDPLVRMKGAGRDENAQLEMAPVLEFLRLLRDESGAAVVFVHHVGHTAGRLRGTSDLEAFWESKVAVEKGDDGVRRVTAEHREAEAGPEFRFRLDWDETSRSMRLVTSEDELERRVAEYLDEHPDESANKVAKELGGNREAVLAAVRAVRSEGGSGFPEPPGTTPRGTSPARGSADLHTPRRGWSREPPRTVLVPPTGNR